MKALIIGSLAAASLGLVCGSHLKPGVHTDQLGLGDAAQAVADFAATPAQAADLEDATFDAPSPVLLVKSDGKWVPDVERQIAREQKASQAQADQAMADEQASLDTPIPIPAEQPVSPDRPDTQPPPERPEAPAAVAMAPASSPTS